MRPEPTAGTGAARAGARETVASAERLVTQSTWVRSGVLRLRREVLTVEYDDYLQPTNGVAPVPGDLPTVDEPPADRSDLTIVLREEIPTVSVEMVPYEVVTARTSRISVDRTVTERLAREQVAVESTAGENAADGRTP